MVEIRDFSKICRICLCPGELKPFQETKILRIFKKITEIEITAEDDFPQNFCVICIQQIEDISKCIDKWRYNDTILKSTLLIKKDEKDEVPILVEMNSSGEAKTEEQNMKGKPMAGKVNSKEFTCNTCNETFTRKRELRAHIKVHYGIEQHKCSVCKRIFAQKGTLTRHLMTHTGAKPFKCNKCGKASSRKDLITEHIIKHHRDDINCGFTFTVSKVIEGVQYEFVKEDAKNRNSTMIDEEFIADSDGRENHNEEVILIKIQNDENNVPKSSKRQRQEVDAGFKCKLCGKSFKKKDYLKSHLALHAQLKAYGCNFCEKEFSHNYALKRHILTHTKERPFQCNVCGNTYTRKEMLSEHMKNHEVGDKPYLCSHCGKSFAHKYGLSKHMKYVKDKADNVEKLNSKCQFCGKQFLVGSHLKAHMITHTGEKRFVCAKCGTRFTAKRSLNEHMSIHDGIKPFQCSHCEKVFRTSSSLRKHSLMHTGKRSFQCTQCPKAFLTASTLKKHIWLHTGERPYSCTSCHKKFVQRNHLQRHLRTHAIERLEDTNDY